MPEGPVDRRFKAEADIAPLSLSEFDQVHALLRLKVEEVLSTVKGRIPVDTLKQPRKYDAAMAQTLVDKGVHSNKGLMQAAVVWHRHYTECGVRPEGPELLFPGRAQRTGGARAGCDAASAATGTVFGQKKSACSNRFAAGGAAHAGRRVHSVVEHRGPRRFCPARGARHHRPAPRRT